MASRREIEEKLIAKAAMDETFRNGLVENPKSAISKELGISIPDGVNVRVLQESADNLYVVLPMPTQGGELNDMELELVAGGVFKAPPPPIKPACSTGFMSTCTVDDTKVNVCDTLSSCR